MQENFTRTAINLGPNGHGPVPERLESDRVPEQAKPADEILLDELRERFRGQLAENGLINEKCGYLFGLIAAVGVLASTSSLFAAVANGSEWPALLPMAFLYVGALVSCLLTVRSRVAYFPVPAKKEELEFYLCLNDRARVVRHILAQYSQTIQVNSSTMKKKAAWLLVSISLTGLLTLGLLATSVAVQLK